MFLFFSDIGLALCQAYHALLELSELQGYLDLGNNNDGGRLSVGLELSRRGLKLVSFYSVLVTEA